MASDVAAAQETPLPQQTLARPTPSQTSSASGAVRLPDATPPPTTASQTPAKGATADASATDVSGVIENVRDILIGMGLLVGFGAVAVLAWAIFVLLRTMIRAFQEGDAVAIHSNWGGFGGGPGGWTLSRPLSLLLGALLAGIFALGLAGTLVSAISSMRPTQKPTAPLAAAPESASSPARETADKAEAAKAETDKSTTGQR